MLEQIDKKPMIRTALAICLGILFALTIASIAVYFYHRFLEGFDLILIAAVTAAVGSVVAWIYFARRHQMNETRRKVLIGTLVVALILGGVVTVSNISRDRARAQAVEGFQRRLQAELKHESDHKYDDLIVEQRWILQHPDDDRLSIAGINGKRISLTPRGQDLEERLAQPLDQGHVKRLSGAGDDAGDYASVAAVQDENRELMQAISNVYGPNADHKLEAQKLGYKYGFDLESARFNVRRAENFIDVFSGVDPILRKKYR